MFSNEDLISGLILRDQNVVIHIYNKFFPGISNWILSNNGEEQDSHDIFHEALLVIYRKILNDDLTLTCKFRSYFTALCKNMWFEELRRRNSLIRINNFEGEHISQSERINLEERLLSLVYEHLNMLESEGKEIFLLSMHGATLSEIREKLGFANNQAVADKKKYCKKKLIQSLQKNSEFKRLFDEIYITN
jgi:RNA polymerase sigma factor (sigma-70 family)